MSKKRKTLGAAMIVKDEEDKLRRCLDTIDHLDQIVIVDTGSTDRTLEIIQQYKDRGVPIEVFHETWIDFSTARNASFSHMTTDWILIIDADEWIPRQQRNGNDPWPLISRALREAGDKTDAFYIELENKLPSDQVLRGDVTKMLRIVPNRPELKWEGAAHNQILSSIIDSPKKEGTPQFSFIEIRMMHDGYNLTGDAKKEKYGRRIPLLRQEIETQKEKGDLKKAQYFIFQLANAHYMCGDTENCLKVFEEELDWEGLEMHNKYSGLLIATAAATKHKDPKTEWYTDELLRMGMADADNPQAMAFLQKGLWYFRMGDYERAYVPIIAAFNLNNDPKVKNLHILDNPYMAGIIGETLLRLGQPLEAKVFFDIAVNTYPHQNWVEMKDACADKIREINVDFETEEGTELTFKDGDQNGKGSDPNIDADSIRVDPSGYGPKTSTARKSGGNKGRKDGRPNRGRNRKRGTTG